MAKGRPGEIRSGYEKISATLEAPVLDTIRKRTANVSGFLNEAAKQKLYFDRLKAAEEELERQGVEVDEALYRYLIERVDARRRPPRIRSVKRRRG